MSQPRHNTPSFRVGPWLGRAALAACVVVTIVPLWVALATAFTPNEELFASASRFFPENPTWFNFQRVLGLVAESDPRLAGKMLPRIDFLRSLINSTIFTVVAVVPQVFFSALAAYAFARLRFAGSRLVFFLFIAASMVPAAVLFIPNFILVRDLGLLNTFPGMAAPVALMTPFAVFYLRQVFLSTPVELEEAARIDGAPPLTIFFRIVLPLHRGPLATLTILAVIASWNEFFWPYLTGRTEGVRVMAVAINAYRSQQPMGGPDWTGLMACVVLAVVPMVVLLLVLGRKIVESVQFTGGK